MTGGRRALRLALWILIGWIAVPVTLTEGAFRLYERYVLTARLPPPGPEGVIDLSRLGYANGPVPVAKGPDEARVLSLGDSFAYGIVLDAHNYNRRLEQNLTRGTGRPLTVVNLGRPSTSFPDYRRELDFWARALPHEAVIVNVYAGNDFVEAARATVSPTPGDFEANLQRAFASGLQVPHRFPLRSADHLHAAYLSWTTRGGPAAGYRATTEMTWDRYVRVMAGAAQVYRRDGRGPDWRGLAGGYVHLRELLARLERARAAGTATLVFVSPPHLPFSERALRFVSARTGADAGGYDFLLPGRIVRAVAEVAGYGGPVYDLYPCLKQHAEAGVPLYYSTDTHWSVEGNGVVGDFLGDLLGHEWARARAARPSSPCSIEAARPQPDGEVARFVAERVAGTRVATLAPLAAEALRGLTEALADRRYADRAALDARLAALGLSQSPPGVRGFLDAVHAGPPDRVTGWAADGSSAVRVLVLLDGAVAAAGAPDGERPDVHRTLLFGPGPDTRPGFALEAAGACAASRRKHRLWLLAVSASRTYAWLPGSGPVSCR